MLIALDDELCFSCHEDRKEEWEGKKFSHGPTAAGECLECHNPHASDNVFWLKKPIWDLCITCHEDKATGRHVIVGFSSNTHPMKDRPDPIREGRDLSCSSCHNPHASDSPKLFNFEVSSSFSLCGVCHKK
jgi:predicted CXXCH cytochrome family protein